MQTNRILFDPNSSDIILITYPPGGFGNFIYHLLTEFTEQTAKPNNSSFAFSSNGNSHSTKKYTVTYFHNPKMYFPYIDADVDFKDKKILVLVDNGWLDNSYQQLMQVFPNAKIVRMCIDPTIYHIIGALMAAKTTGNPINFQSREHFGNQSAFRPLSLPNVVNMDFKEFIINPEKEFIRLLGQLELTLINYQQLVDAIAKWQTIHTPYFNGLYK